MQSSFPGSPLPKKSTPQLSVYGARQHNLQAVTVHLPKQSLVVVTGVSGSGKTSLLFDTIYAEAERRFMESLSSDARLYLEQAQKPDVDRIEGIGPAIAIGKSAHTPSARSTVATLTDIYDFLRVLYARTGSAACPKCGNQIRMHSPQSIANSLARLPNETRLQLLAPMVRSKTGEHKKLLADLQRQGFTRVRIDDEIQLLESVTELEAGKRHSIDVVVDRLEIGPDVGSRLMDSIELALRLSGGRVLAVYPALNGPALSGDSTQPGAMLEEAFTNRFACAVCDFEMPALEPRLFSFGSIGACPKCHGLGYVEAGKNRIAKTCPACNGSRLSKDALMVQVGGRSIAEFCDLSVGAALRFASSLEFEPGKREIAEPLLEEILKRLQFLFDMGLSYLTLGRSGATLSTGEVQRIRLASQLGAALSGVLYMLDEPSIGLHPRDTARLLSALVALKAGGNSVFLVEHDTAIINAADYVCELGPGAGAEGGRVIACGTPQELAANPASVTGPFLSAGSGQAILKAHPPRRLRRHTSENWIEVRNANLFTLRNLSARLPTEALIAVTGVSGSGKSTLINRVLYPIVHAKLSRTAVPAQLREIEISGINSIDTIRAVDQTPIGKSPRSNPATYVEAFPPIRELFSQLPEARSRGYTASRFSSNVRGGRCEHCQGNGTVAVEMLFLPDMQVPCPECGGRRYNRDVLEILYRGYSIADVLEMRVTEAHQLFIRVPGVEPRLRALIEVGLGYLQLGQSAQTLSGGEAQRVKLAAELGKKPGSHTLYLLDEPTTGLHPQDVVRLIAILNRLVDQGHTVIAIEHNMDVIAASDWCIDMGPEAGESGGQIVVAGTPEELAATPGSHTGKYLKSHLGVA